MPAHYDEQEEKYVLDVPFPCKFDKENRRWLFDQPDTWENVIKRFKERGPENKQFVERIQTGYHEYEKLRSAS